MDKKRRFVQLLILTAALLVGVAGCKSGLESKDPKIRAAAVQRLADQEKLTQVALEDQDRFIRLAAVEKLTDQRALARVATEDDDFFVREEAVGRLTDQAALAKIAFEDKSGGVRRRAVEKLVDPDQTLLTRVAIADRDSDVRMAAVEKITDPALKARLASPVGRAMAISQLQDSDPILMKIASDWKGMTPDARVCIARMKLAAREPHIQSRLPGLQCLVTANELSQTYIGSSLTSIHGEFVKIGLHQSGKTLAESSWITKFPGSATSTYFRTADVNGGELLKKLLHRSAFTQEDLVELNRSKIPEVRFGAVGNLSDHELLALSAMKDEEWRIRQVALERISDQNVLAKAATEDKEPAVRQAAVKKLVDQGLLAKVAAEDIELGVRLAAVEKLTDRTLLEKVEVENNYQAVRRAAKDRILALGQK